MKVHRLLGLSLFLSLSGWAQYKVSPDCDSLKPIVMPNKYVALTTYGMLNDHGKVKDISGYPATSKQFFEEEHHSCWFKVVTSVEGKFVMTVTPLDSKDDYDFLIFATDPATFCSDLRAKKILPVRSNLARGDSITGAYRTGLSNKGTAAFVGQGKGNPYSLPLDVKAGQTLFIVVDNVKSTKGCTIEFGFLTTVTVSGTVSNESGKPVVANMEITNQNGDPLYKGLTRKDGSYKIDVLIWQNTPNMLFLEADSTFFASIQVNTSSVDYKYTNVKTVLEKLKKGKKFSMGVIQFVPGQDNLLQGSLPNVKALMRLMKKNPGMIIRIEGHVNAAGMADQKNYQLMDMSERRAKRVLGILAKNGIEEKRMSIIGFGANYMIYPTAVTEWQAQQNRRVEINVLSLDGFLPEKKEEGK